jgi:hypothetical protein
LDEPDEAGELGGLGYGGTTTAEGETTRENDSRKRKDREIERIAESRGLMDTETAKLRAMTKRNARTTKGFDGLDRLNELRELDDWED